MTLTQDTARAYRAARQTLGAADALRQARWMRDDLNRDIRDAVDDARLARRATLDLGGGLAIIIRVTPDDLTPEDAGFGRYTSDEGALRDRASGAIAIGRPNAREGRGVSRPDWQVATVATSAATGGLCIQGMNHMTGERFIWHIHHHGLLWTYRERYGRFRGAAFGPGARKRLAVLLRMARKREGR